MRIAVIDLGTNSVRFDVREVIPGEPVRRLYRERLMVKLGQGVFETGRLHPDAERRTLQAFLAFREIGERYGVERYVAVGTSALRDAEGAKRFVGLVEQRTGIAIRTISGSDEARYIARGFVANDPRKLRGPFLLVDIGGGSTEFTLARSGKRFASVSVNIGAARLHQLFFARQAPPGAAPSEPMVAALRSFIRSALAEVPLLRGVKGVRCIGSSGTIRAVCKLGKKGGDSITASALHRLVEKLVRADRRSLLALPRMEENRAELIVAGAVLLEEIVNLVNPKKIETTEYSLRDGIIEDERARVPKSSTEATRGALTRRVSDVVRRERHRADWREFSDQLFEKLLPVHRLSKRWAELYSVIQALDPIADLLGDYGRDGPMVGLLSHGSVIELPEHEREIVRMIFTLRQGGKLRNGELTLSPSVSTRRLFHRLLAVVRLGYALQSSLKPVPRIRRCDLRRDKVRLLLDAEGYIDVALLRVETVQELFRLAFGRSIEVSFSRE